VTSLLLKGKNAVGMIGNGQYGYLGVWCSQGPTACQAFLLQIQIHLKNGQTVIITSDETWKGAQGF